MFYRLSSFLAAKQEAFEESAKLKNQFRALNNDEVDFLDSALESTRAREEAIRKETREQLELFRRRQEQADKVGEADEDATKGSLTGVEGAQKSLENDVEWNVSTKKRKRVKEKEGLKGVKTRRTSSTDDQKQEAEAAVANVEKERPKCSSSGAAAQSNSVSTTSSPLSVKQTPGKLVANGQVSVLPAAKGSLALVGYDSEDEST